MSKKRLYEIAKELGKESKRSCSACKRVGLGCESHSSSVEEAVAAKIAASFKPAAAPKQKQNLQHQKQVQKRKPKNLSQQNQL